LNDILDVGHAAIHRAYEPKAKEIQIALDITEGVLAAIFVHVDAAKEISQNVPARPKRPSSQMQCRQVAHIFVGI
jgi:hypothetical protein